MTTVVLVTGCSNGGIGFHLCQQFAEEGCKVYATSRKLESMSDFQHPAIKVLAMDVTSDEGVQKAVQTIIDAEGRIDILVNNAGLACIGPIAEIALESVKQTFDANVFGAMRTAKAVFPHMASRKSGLVVNIGSISGELASPWAGVYNATKAALHSITQNLYMECLPFNINVMLVAPGSIKSNFSNNQSQVFTLPEDSLYKDYLDGMVKRMWASQTGRPMPTDKFAKAVVKKALAKKPPMYFSIGGNVTLVAISKWLPRTFVLYYLWKMFSGRK